MIGVPVIMFCFTWHLQWIFGDLLDKSILDGFLVLSCMPPPVSSAVVLTRAVEGNDAAAVCASALGSFLGLIVTPLSLLFWTGMETTADVSKTVMKLGGTVVLPIIVGQILRGSFGPMLDRLNIPHSKISNILLLSIIYSTFCDTFDEEVAVSSGSLLFIIFFTVFFQGLILALMLTSAPILDSKLMTLSPKDVMCTLFVCSHKSLTMGFPLLKLMYSGKPELSLVSIPLLVYHPTQILLGSLLSPYFRQWRINAETYGSYFVVNTAETKEDEGFEIF
jgi:sodium/bile acid cotransporter 7